MNQTQENKTRIKDYSLLAEDIIRWLRDYCTTNKLEGFVAGVSGGVDSATISALCAATGLPCYFYSIDIQSHKDNSDKAFTQLKWLNEKFDNTNIDLKDLTIVYNLLNEGMYLCPLAKANTKSRLRMLFLYAEANNKNCLVCGTGNKIEDYGIGYCTKGGDQVVDISPIGDLLKSEVRELARFLGVPEEIVTSIPNDGLHGGSPDEFSDEKRIGVSYDELEEIMLLSEHPDTKIGEYTKRHQKVWDLYHDLHSKNSHKNQMPPIFKVEHSKYQ